MMTNRLLIQVKCLKDFLSLFDKEQKFKSLAFCDTWHPSSGYVDESFLVGKNRIKDILGSDYEFNGLVGFEAEIGNIKIHLLKHPNEDSKLEEYVVSGAREELRTIQNKIIEQNAYYPNKYHSSFMSEWN
jgi:hypothetical protein